MQIVTPPSMSFSRDFPAFFITFSLNSDQIQPSSAVKLDSE